MNRRTKEGEAAAICNEEPAAARIPVISAETGAAAEEVAGAEAATNAIAKAVAAGDTEVAADPSIGVVDGSESLLVSM